MTLTEASTIAFAGGVSGGLAAVVTQIKSHFYGFTESDKTLVNIGLGLMSIGQDFSFIFQLGYIYKNQLPKDSGNKLPTDNAQTSNIFGDRPAHLPDTLENRGLLENIANDKANYLGIDQFGNEVYSQMQSNGSQIWIYVRNGTIQNGGRKRTSVTLRRV